MKLAHNKNEVRQIVSDWRKQDMRVALVPTMGALHEGHISLIQQARQNSDHVVVSIFVNPTQFGPGEDFEHYPRQLNKDVELCRKEGVSLVFAPDQKEMYGHNGHKKGFISFAISEMNENLCGAARPGHFEGVLQVVNKLFQIVRPDVAIFGQKDIQQWFIIRQLVEETDQPVEILMAPTVREKDGLAQSSRNVYLTPTERKKAPLLFESLQRFSAELSENVQQITNKKDIIPVDKTRMDAEIKHLKDNGFDVEYFLTVSTPDLQASDVIIPGRLYIVAVAARLGSTRLIDNVLLNTNRLPAS